MNDVRVRKGKARVQMSNSTVINVSSIVIVPIYFFFFSNASILLLFFFPPLNPVIILLLMKTVALLSVENVIFQIKIL